MKETHTHPSNSGAMGSVISNHLCQVSSNLQRVPSRPDPPRDGYLDTTALKRRRLEVNSRSSQEDDYWDDAIPAALCEPSISLTTAFGQGSNQSAQILPETDRLSNRLTEPHHASCFRKEIMMGLLEIVDKLDEIDELHSLIEAEFETRCTLEIFIAKYEQAPGGMKLSCGEDVWRSQQMGLIRTISEDFGHSTSRVILPRPFVVPAEDLFVKKRSKAMKSTPDKDHRLGLSDQYIVKVWLEAPNSESRWPPLELDSVLDPNGRMMIGLRKGTSSTTDLRLMCKGTLFPEGGTCGSFDIVLKLGGVQVQTSYTLKLDIKYSMLPQVRTRPKTPHFQGVESLGGGRHVSETHSQDLTTGARCPPNSRADDVDMEDNKPAETPSQKPPKSPPLAVPRTKRRLFDAVIKNILHAEEELDSIDDTLEVCWRTTKHVEMIKDNPDIGINAKDYIIKWDLYVTPLRLSCNFYVPQVLLRFVEDNKAWFAEYPSRIREFSLHATSLRLRGSIDIECFAKCINLLPDCIEPATELEDKPWHRWCCRC